MHLSWKKNKIELEPGERLDVVVFMFNTMGQGLEIGRVGNLLLCPIPAPYFPPSFTSFNTNLHWTPPSFPRSHPYTTPQSHHSIPFLNTASQSYPSISPLIPTPLSHPSFHPSFLPFNLTPQSHFSSFPPHSFTSQSHPSIPALNLTPQSQSHPEVPLSARP